MAKKFENDPNPHYKINTLDWIKTQIEELGYKQVVQLDDSLAVELGSRTLVIGIEGDVDSCKTVTAMLKILRRYKDQGLDTKTNGMVFIFSRQPINGSLADAYKKKIKSKVFIKQYIVTEKDLPQIASTGESWFKYDQNPEKILGSEVATFVKRFGHPQPDLNKVVNSTEVKKFQEGLKQMLTASKKWGADQFVLFQDKIKNQPQNDEVKEKLSDLQKHIELYDEVRRGLWERAQQTNAQIHFPSEKLKNEIGKGRHNIENILKTIKADTQNIEKDIRSSFDENKKFVQEELKEKAISQ